MVHPPNGTFTTYDLTASDQAGGVAKITKVFGITEMNLWRANKTMFVPVPPTGPKPSEEAWTTAAGSYSWLAPGADNIATIANRFHLTPKQIIDFNNALQALPGYTGKKCRYNPNDVPAAGLAIPNLAAFNKSLSAGEPGEAEDDTPPVDPYSAEGGPDNNAAAS